MGYLIRFYGILMGNLWDMYRILWGIYRILKDIEGY